MTNWKGSVTRELSGQSRNPRNGSPIYWSKRNPMEYRPNSPFRQRKRSYHCWQKPNHRGPFTLLMRSLHCSPPTWDQTGVTATHACCLAFLQGEKNTNAGSTNSLMAFMASLTLQKTFVYSDAVTRKRRSRHWPWPKLDCPPGQVQRLRSSTIRQEAPVQGKQCSLVHGAQTHRQRRVEPDPSKVEAIKEMPRPADKAVVHCFLGVCQYLSKFVRICLELSYPSGITWSNTHEDAFKSAKELIASATVLRYYDQFSPVTLQVDASENTIGWVLLQENQTVSLTSHTLNATEKKYCMPKLKKNASRYSLVWPNGISIYSVKATSQCTRTINPWS